MKHLVLRLESKGCASCIATAIIHLLRIRGVKGAYMRGRDLVIVLEDYASVESVLNDPSLNTYYKIIDWYLASGGIRSTYSYRFKPGVK